MAHTYSLPVILSGLIPVLFVSYISSPFVNYIHLRLPAFTRKSHELLMRYSKSPPKDAQLEFTTMNLVGKPIVTRVKAGELYPTKERFGLANYAHDTKRAGGKRPLWAGKPVRQFGVHGSRGRIPESGVWDNIAMVLKRR